MPRRTVTRTGWVLLFVAIAAGVIVQNLRFDASSRTEQRSSLAFDQNFASANLALADVRTAQTSYVATGQGSDFWTTRVTALFDQLDAAVTAAESASQSAQATPHYEAATAALQGLTKVDSRIRENLNGGQRFLASDLIFQDALDANHRLAGELAAAHDAERSAADQRTAQIARWRLMLNAGALAIGVLLMLIVSLRERVDADVATAPVVQPPASIADARVSLEPLAFHAVPAVSDAEVGVVAELCVDLARLLDARDMPALMARSANALGAKGLVLWMAEPGGTKLAPTLAHGYSDRVLQRLGTLPVDADNVTSLAFRTFEVQAMPAASPDAYGAIAVPLITGYGCIGVLAAEVPLAKSGDLHRALARMIAAQLSTCVAPASPASRQAHG